MVATSSPDQKTASGGDSKWALKPHRTIKPPTKESPLLVVVLDGWGARYSKGTTCALLVCMPCTSAGCASWRHCEASMHPHDCIAAEQHMNGGYVGNVTGEAPDADDNAIALAGSVHSCMNAGPFNMCRCASICADVPDAAGADPAAILTCALCDKTDTPTMDGLKDGAPEHWRTVHAHGTYVGELGTALCGCHGLAVWLPAACENVLFTYTCMPLSQGCQQTMTWETQRSASQGLSLHA
jgi:hypothetical protein